MKIVIVSDASEMRGRLLEKSICDFFQKDQVLCFNAAKARIGYCIGCFACRVKTPGKCIFEDDMDEILRAYVDCDVLIILTAMKYGCHSSVTKCFLDRTIPLETPFLRGVDGEVHMTARYPRQRRLLAVAYGDSLDPDDCIVYNQLIKRNAINLDMKRHKTIFVEGGEDIQAKLARAWRDL